MTLPPAPRATGRPGLGWSADLVLDRAGSSDHCTVFVETQRQERGEVGRAKQSMQRCAAEAHTARDEEWS
jgi:hypothetical protein